MALPEAGLEWVNVGLTAFQNGLVTIREQMAGLSSDMEKTDEAGRKSSTGMDILSGAVIGVASKITEYLIGAVVEGTKQLIAFGTETIGLATQFQSMETALSIAAGAAATAVADQFGGLGEIALRVGGDTRLMGVSATGAAGALTDLLKTGLSLEDALGDLNSYMAEGGQLGGVLRASIDLAAATELDMGEASKFASATMRQFGLTADDVQGTMDYFLRSANSSAASVSDIRDGLSNAGPTLRNFGMSVEDSADALALLTNAGISGSEAGTALRSMFGAMTKDNKKVVAALKSQGIVLTDLNGNYLDFFKSTERGPSILGQFEVALRGMSEAQKTDFATTVAGYHGQKALLNLVNQGTQGYLDYADAVAGASGIQAQAASIASTLAGQQEALAGNVETLRIRIGDALLPIMSSLTSVMSSIVEDYGPLLVDFFTAVGKAIIPFADYLAAVFKNGTDVNSFLEALPGWAQPFMEAIGDVVEFLDKVAQGIGNFKFMVDAGVDPLKAIHIALDTAFGKEAGDRFDTFIGKITPFVEGVKIKFGEVQSWLATNIPLIKGEIAELFSILTGKGYEPQEPITLPGVEAGLGAGQTSEWQDQMTTATEESLSGWEAFKQWLATNVPIMKGYIQGLIDKTVEFATGEFWTWVTGEWDKWVEWWNTDGELLRKAAEKVMDAISGGAGDTGFAFQQLSDAVSLAMETVRAAINLLSLAVLGDWEGFQAEWERQQLALGDSWDRANRSLAVRARERTTALQAETPYVKEAGTALGAAIFEGFNAGIAMTPVDMEAVGRGLYLPLTNMQGDFSTIGRTFGENVPNGLVAGVNSKMATVTSIYSELAIATSGPSIAEAFSKSGEDLSTLQMMGLTTGVARERPNFLLTLGNLAKGLLGTETENWMGVGLGLGGTLGTGLGTGISQAEPVIRTSADKSLGKPITDILGALPGAAITALGLVSSAMETHNENIKANTGTKWKGVRTSIETEGAGIQADANLRWTGIRTDIDTHQAGVATDTALRWKKIWTEITTQLGIITTDADTAYETLRTGADTEQGRIETESAATWNAIATDTGTTLSGMVTKAIASFETLRLGIVAKLGEYGKPGGVVGAVETGMAAVDTVIAEHTDDMYTMGKEYTQGFQDGVIGGFDALIGAVRQAFTDLEAFCRHILGIASGSKVMKEIGLLFDVGFTEGVLGGAGGMRDAVQSAMGKAMEIGQDVLSGGKLTMNGNLAGQKVYAGGSTSSVDRSRSINVEINPTYRNYESEARIYYDVTAALAAVRI